MLIPLCLSFRNFLLKFGFVSNTDYRAILKIKIDLRIYVIFCDFKARCRFRSFFVGFLWKINPVTFLKFLHDFIEKSRSFWTFWKFSSYLSKKLDVVCVHFWCFCTLAFIQKSRFLNLFCAMIIFQFRYVRITWSEPKTSSSKQFCYFWLKLRAIWGAWTKNLENCREQEPKKSCLFASHDLQCVIFYTVFWVLILFAIFSFYPKPSRICRLPIVVETFYPKMAVVRGILSAAAASPLTTICPVSQSESSNFSLFKAELCRNFSRNIVYWGLEG